MPNIIFTICSNNYLAQAITLGGSVTEYYPNTRFVIGLVDIKHGDIDYESYRPHEFLTYDAMGYEEFDDMIERYNIVEFNTAVKPFYFEYLSKQLKEGETIWYIDPDILLYDRLQDVESALVPNLFALVPHIVYPQLKQGQFEKLILNVGMYNMGFLGTKRSQESMEYFRWWQARLKYDCRISFSEGLFTDQIWTNYIPCFYDDVAIIKNPGIDVAYWNFKERFISLKEGKYYVNDKFKLSLFHFSSFNPLHPDKLCRWLEYSFEQRPDLKPLYQDYTERLIMNGYAKYSNLPRGLEFKKNHPHYDTEKDSKNSDSLIRVVDFIIRLLVRFKKKYSQFSNI